MAYIFLDESGKPEVFSARGVNLVEKKQATKYLVISAVRTENHLLLQQKIADFRADILRDVSLTKIFSTAYALDNFHASRDYPEVRKKFYSLLIILNLK